MNNHAISHETRDCATAVELIVSGVAVGLLPASVVAAPQNRTRLVVIERDPGVQFPHRDVLTITRVGFQTRPGEILLSRIAEMFSRIPTDIGHPKPK